MCLLTRHLICNPLQIHSSCNLLKRLLRRFFSSFADQKSLQHLKSFSLSDQTPACRDVEKNQENSLAAAVPSEIRSNLIMEAMDGMLCCIPGPSSGSTILSGPPECHSRPLTPSPNDTMDTTGNSINSAPALPLDAQVGRGSDILESTPSYC